MNQERHQKNRLDNEGINVDQKEFEKDRKINEIEQRRIQFGTPKSEVTSSTTALKNPGVIIELSKRRRPGWSMDTEDQIRYSD